MPAIRFIVQNVRTWNRNGYHYRCAKLVATATGKSVFVASVGGDENVRGVLGRVTGDSGYPAIFQTHEEVGAREFSRLGKFHASHTIYEDGITAEMVAALESEGGK